MRLKLFRFLALIAELTESSGLLKSVLQKFNSTEFALAGDEHLRNRVRFKFHCVFNVKYQRTGAELIFHSSLTFQETTSLELNLSKNEFAQIKVSSNS